MYIQVLKGRIVGVSETPNKGFDRHLDLPDDFDFDHCDRYEVTDSGELVYHESDGAEAATMEDRFTKMENAIDKIMTIIAKFNVADK